MTRRIRVRGIRREEIDEDKLALAFLMLAKELHEQAQKGDDCHELGETMESDETAADGRASS